MQFAVLEQPPASTNYLYIHKIAADFFHKFFTVKLCIRIINNYFVMKGVASEVNIKNLNNHWINFCSNRL